jgi:hypothetical protein
MQMDLFRQVRDSLRHGVVDDSGTEAGRTGVNVMAIIFGNLCKFSAEKWALFSRPMLGKKNVLQLVNYSRF